MGSDNNVERVKEKLESLERSRSADIWLGEGNEKTQAKTGLGKQA